MAVTRLERKGRKNKAVAKKRTAAIKLHLQKPVIKNVDIEVIKTEFEASKKKPAAKKEEANKAVEVKPEKPANVTTEKPADEVKEKPKAKKSTKKKTE